MTPLAVIDANLLAPSLSRAVLNALTAAELVAPVISRKIAREAWRACRRIHPDTARIAQRDVLHCYRTWSVVTPERVDVALPDPNDGHVVGAALAAKSEIILTENLRDFPTKRLGPLGLTSLPLDRFVASMLPPAATTKALSELSDHAAVPLPRGDELYAALRRARLGRLAALLASEAAISSAS